MDLLDYSHRRLIILGAVVLALFIFFPTLFGMLFPASDEVSYSAGISSSTCEGFFVDEDSAGRNCTTRYAITVGNTGTNNQELVTIEVNNLPASLPFSWNALDIVASSVRAAVPQITQVPQNYGRRLVIADLAPNRLVEFTLVARGSESLVLLQDINVTVLANGRAIKSNPTLTVISRFFKNVFGIFGF